MGVPKFARWLMYNAKNAVVKHGQLGDVDSVSIDLNGLLHKAFQLIYTENILDKSNSLMKEGNKLIESKKKEKINEGELLLKESETLKNQYEEGKKLIKYGNQLINQGNTKTGEYKVREGTSIINERKIMRRVGKSEDLIEKLEKDYQEMVWKLIKDVIKEFGEFQTLVLCIDGPAIQGKQRQQRQRRFKSAKLNNTLLNFDSNIITPGTEFMIRLDNYLENQIVNNRDALPAKVIFSGSLTEGEGEHKCVEYYRQGQVPGASNHILYGLDADLVMLSLLSPQKNIILSRESQENMINIEEFKKYLINIMGSKSAVSDFVIMMFLIGNDFLPHSSTLENMEDTINLMIDIYKKGLGKYKFSNNHILDVANLASFITELANEEQRLLKDLAFREDYYSEPLKAAKTNEGFDLNLYREAYYNKEFAQKSTIMNDLYEVTDDHIKNMVHDYIKTLSWNYLYYHEGQEGVNEEWLYAYYYSPMLVDLAVYSNIIPTGYETYKGITKINPLHQLISVLPRTSIHIVPEELKYFFSILSPISDLFPATFINDQEGIIQVKMQGRPLIDYGIAMIPLVDRRRIIDVLPLIEMSDERYQMWERKEPIINSVIRLQKQYQLPGKKQYQKQYQPKPQYQQPYQPKPQYQQPYQVKTQYQQPYQPKLQYQQPYQVKTQYQQPYQVKTQYQQYQPKQHEKQPYQPKQHEKQPYQKPVKTYTPRLELGKDFNNPEQEKLPEMINLNNIENYIKTGFLNKNAKQQIFESDWNL